MELGALVCTAGCARLPAPARFGRCAWPTERGTVASRPVKRKKASHAATTTSSPRSCRAMRIGDVLIIRRPPTGLLGGLWGFPGGIAADGRGA